MGRAPDFSSKIAYRVLPAFLLWGGFSTSLLGQASKDFDRSHSSTEDWALPWTALTIAPDGSWEVATEVYSYQAIAGAIANCKRMYKKEIGCGYQSRVDSGGLELSNSMRRRKHHSGCKDLS